MKEFVEQKPTNKDVKIKIHKNGWVITVDSKSYLIPLEVIAAIIKLYKEAIGCKHTRFFRRLWQKLRKYVLTKSK